MAPLVWPVGIPVVHCLALSWYGKGPAHREWYHPLADGSRYHKKAGCVGPKEQASQRHHFMTSVLAPLSRFLLCHRVHVCVHCFLCLSHRVHICVHCFLCLCHSAHICVHIPPPSVAEKDPKWVHLPRYLCDVTQSIFKSSVLDWMFFLTWPIPMVFSISYFPLLLPLRIVDRTKSLWPLHVSLCEYGRVQKACSVPTSRSSQSSYNWSPLPHNCDEWSMWHTLGAGTQPDIVTMSAVTDTLTVAFERSVSLLHMSLLQLLGLRPVPVAFLHRDTVPFNNSACDRGHVLAQPVPTLSERATMVWFDRGFDIEMESSFLKLYFLHMSIFHRGIPELTHDWRRGELVFFGDWGALVPASEIAWQYNIMHLLEQSLGWETKWEKPHSPALSKCKTISRGDCYGS